MTCKDCGRDIYPGEAFAVIRRVDDDGDIWLQFQCLDCADMEMLKKEGESNNDGR